MKIIPLEGTYVFIRDTSEIGVITEVNAEICCLPKREPHFAIQLLLSKTHQGDTIYCHKDQFGLVGGECATG